ncbi:30S ribosomal protein S2 [Lentisphaera marina]|uniref:30S ribosomal protein S2 n=1 Tax=Lentisphaera marina TaxID=1111041 RepID=UPI00236587E8|nr:30S ribosomal protein S2 [Lentisphaera marina]MDD7983386.1 30S ribosomal protein S2 [Lentisphaera marina]
MSIKITDLLEAGVHFGHQTRRWNPKMKPYIYGSRNGIHIFDLSKTMVALNNACKFLYSTVADGGDVLFIGTKRQSQEIVEEAAKASNMHYISYRWLGGTLTNLTTIRKSVAKLKKYTKMEEDGTLDAMKKKEASQIRREKTKLENSLSGIIDLQRPPAVVVIVDINKEHIAIKEAHSLGIPVVAILDSNSNPDSVTHGIPGNDDAVRSVQVIFDQLSAAVVAGKGIADAKAAEKAKEDKIKAEKAKAEKAEKIKADKEKAEKAKAEKAEKAKEAKAKKAAEAKAKKAEEAKAAPAKEEKAEEAAPAKAEEAAPKAKKAPAKKAAAKKAPAKEEKAEEAAPAKAEEAAEPEAKA